MRYLVRNGLDVLDYLEKSRNKNYIERFFTGQDLHHHSSSLPKCFCKFNGLGRVSSFIKLLKRDGKYDELHEGYKILLELRKACISRDWLDCDKPILEKYIPDLFKFVEDGEVTQSQLEVFLKGFDLGSMLNLNLLSKSLYNSYLNISPYSFQNNFVNNNYTMIFDYGDAEGVCLAVYIRDITKEDLIAKILKANSPNEEV